MSQYNPQYQPNRQQIIGDVQISGDGNNINNIQREFGIRRGGTDTVEST